MKLYAAPPGDTKGPDSLKKKKRKDAVEVKHQSSLSSLSSLLSFITYRLVVVL